MADTAPGSALPSALPPVLLDGSPFALLHRPHATGQDGLELLLGDITAADRLADLPLDTTTPAAEGPRHELLAILPYRQITERGYACNDDGAPLVVMSVREQRELSVARLLAEIPDVPQTLSDAGFDIEDEEYARIVRKVLAEEIGNGAGANFVIKRSFVATVEDWSPAAALALFGRLLARESGTYWTFLVHTGDRTFVGASPERHVSLEAGTVTMNPISGTYRYPASGPTVEGALGLLADRKEREELHMVVDEELKMMTRICDPGVRVEGPYLKEMKRLAHTEYFIRGESSLDAREILRETMFAPTITGSPVESACRVLRQYEPRGRSYYSGALALIGRDGDGRRAMDSAILIRTAEVDRAGRLELGVGATLVRHSDPESEVAETHAKAAGLLGALRDEQAPDDRREAAVSTLALDPRVQDGLTRYNQGLARFWLEPRPSEHTELAGLRVLVVDNEDTFTAMLGHQLRSLGPQVTIHTWYDLPESALDDVDLVVVGPGPGDPRQSADPKIAAVRSLVERLLEHRIPCVAVCLGHQVVSGVLGLPLVRKEVPNQGLQEEIDFFGSQVRVGFYNAFAGRTESDRIHLDGSGTVEISRDTRTGEVHGLRGPGFATAQFHPESLLTEHGPALLHDLVTTALKTPYETDMPNHARGTDR
ncbi:chorismate-binding protein [Streptomyces sp. CBMA152]|uniref:chorismate-binding protein n=1 Tax=Streptomyces sp. CBMA152 TaxID=1896312 RepID=UPI001660AF07|nr:chorismate-binding protein [Streptomyces sp. CBMA152]MBD0741870.1 phenazine-specific anthranilate synthase component I [Streptomyces sp. CBMA152]